MIASAFSISRMLEDSVLVRTQDFEPAVEVGGIHLERNVEIADQRDVAVTRQLLQATCVRHMIS